MQVEKLEKEPCLLRAAESKARHPKLLEETDRPEEDSEGNGSKVWGGSMGVGDEIGERES